MQRGARHGSSSPSGMLGPLLTVGFAATLLGVFVAAWFLRFDPRFLVEIVEWVAGPVATR